MHITWSMPVLIMFKNILISLRRKLVVYFLQALPSLRMFMTFYLSIYCISYPHNLFNMLSVCSLSVPLTYVLLLHARYDQLLKTSHAFNILDSRGFVGVTERARYFGRMRR